MSGEDQRAKLHAQIWKIANEVRGSVDSWDFKQFVLGTIFYRYISENFTKAMENDDEGIDYASYDDDAISKDLIEDQTKIKGFFIKPSQLYCNVCKDAATNENLNIELSEIFKSIEASAEGFESEDSIKGLFADFDTTSNRLGSTVKEKNKRLVSVLKGVEGLDFGNFEDNKIDLFGDAYEFLISNYAANAGKSGGEFFTPQSVSKLLSKIVVLNQEDINHIYDPAAGSGSLLLHAKGIISGKFYAQEINHTTYNLARMNMFLHNVNYYDFHIELGDTLTNPKFLEDAPFDAIVSNPPYSVNWIGKDDPTLINDERFSSAGVLAPNSKADYAFVLHTLHYLSNKGKAAIVCFPGIFYRTGAERKIRKYLVDNNYIDTIIALPPNLFFGTSISVNILVLSKNKENTNIQFIDTNSERFFKKATNNNIISDEQIEDILNIFDERKDLKHIVKQVKIEEIVENDYNLSTSTYIETVNTKEVINIKELNQEIEQTVNKIDKLRSEIDLIIKEIES